MEEDERGGGFSLFDLVFWPVTLPVRSLRFILEQIAEAVDREMDDTQTVRRRMQELEDGYRRGEIDEVSFQAAWDELATRWQALKEAGEGAGGAGPEAGSETGEGAGAGHTGRR